MPLPVPPLAVPHVPKSNALEWRGFPQRKLCSHVSSLHGNFFPLATDGERCIVETTQGVVLMTQLSAIEWPRAQGSARTRTPSTKSLKSRAHKQLAKLGLSEEDILELLNV